MDQVGRTTKAKSLLLEGIFQAYLNLVQDTTIDRWWHNRSDTPFIATIRTSIAGAPTFSRQGLNPTGPESELGLVLVLVGYGSEEQADQDETQAAEKNCSAFIAACLRAGPGRAEGLT